MDKSVIKIRGLHKKFVYLTDRNDTLKSQVLDMLRLKRRPRFERELYGGLDLEIRRGEVVAFLGVNGSGKSTLLKLIAGIYTPDQGQIAVDGRIGALIELGAGFHPEFSGRENIRIYAQILGIDRRQIERLVPEIIEFSELGNYIDQPVKIYSSGMYMRLAFSVAVTIDPDVLIIDEILAVGDFNFANKCRRKMNEFKERGKTICLVSHDLDTVRSWATRAVVLDKGQVAFDGDPIEGVRFYLQRCLNESEVKARNQPAEPTDTAAVHAAFDRLMSPLVRGYPIEAPATPAPRLVICVSSAYSLLKSGYCRHKLLFAVALWEQMLARDPRTRLSVVLFHNATGAERLGEELRRHAAHLSSSPAIAETIDVDFCPVSAGKALAIAPGDVALTLDWPSLAHLQATKLWNSRVGAMSAIQVVNLSDGVDAIEWPRGEIREWLLGSIRRHPLTELNVPMRLQPVVEANNESTTNAPFSVCLLSDAALSHNLVNMALRSLIIFVSRRTEAERRAIRITYIGDLLPNAELIMGVRADWITGEDWVKLPLGASVCLVAAEHDYFTGFLGVMRKYEIPICGPTCAADLPLTELEIADQLEAAWRAPRPTVQPILAMSGRYSDELGTQRLSDPVNSDALGFQETLGVVIGSLGSA